MEGVEVIDSIRLVNGQSYQSYCQQWMNWVVSLNPEINNQGPVCFLHGVPSWGKQDDENYSKPVIRIGSQAIEINVGEYVFFPIINAFYESSDPRVSDDPESLLNWVKMDLAGPRPNARQATITNIERNQIENIVPDLSPFLIITPEFLLNVPPAWDGAKLLRTNFDGPMLSDGIKKCVVGGFWILLKFNNSGKFYIHTYARGPRQYRTGMFYQINVSGVAPIMSYDTEAPEMDDWTKASILQLAEKKLQQREITEEHNNAIITALK
jgi:hypothetical protein